MNTFELMFSSINPEDARFASKIGVDRIWVDLENLNKRARQGSNPRISSHTIGDVAVVRNAVKNDIIVRINPINKNSRDEILKVIDSGADIIMLPMFDKLSDVEFLLNTINGRVKSNLLFETSAAFARMDMILQIKEIDEIYLGINDLHLQMNLKFMFEILAFGLVDYFVYMAKKYKKRYGFGGITKMNSGKLNSNLILSENVRLDCSMVILSREIQDLIKNKNEFEYQITQIRDEYEFLKNQSLKQLQKNKLKISKSVKEIIKNDF